MSEAPASALPVVAVRGEVFREVEPEIARCAVHTAARARDRQETLRRLSERVEALRGLLDGYRDVIESRATAGLHVYPDRESDRDRIKGYRGSVSTTLVVTDFAVLGDLMLRLADQDDTSIGGPWELRPGSPVHREARTAAIGDAIERARQYAAALGARVIRLVELADAGMGGQNRQATRGMYATALSGQAGPPQLDLEPRLQQVRAEIEARFLISEPTVLAEPPH